MNHKVKFFDNDTYVIGQDGQLPFFVCQTNGINVSNIKINKELCNALNKALTSFDINLAKAKNRAKVACKQTFTVTDPTNNLEKFVLITINLAEANNEFNWMINLHSNDSVIKVIQGGVNAIKACLGLIEDLEVHPTFGKYDGIEFTNSIPDPLTMTEKVCYVLTKEIPLEYSKDTVFMANENSLYVFDKATGELTKVITEEEEIPQGPTIQGPEFVEEEEEEMVTIEETEAEESSNEAIVASEEAEEAPIEEIVEQATETTEDNVDPVEAGLVTLYKYEDGQLLTFSIDDEDAGFKNLDHEIIIIDSGIYKSDEEGPFYVFNTAKGEFFKKDEDGRYYYIGIAIVGGIDDEVETSIDNGQVFVIAEEGNYLGAFIKENDVVTEIDLPIYETEYEVLVDDQLYYVIGNEYIGSLDDNGDLEPITSMQVIYEGGN